MVPIYINENKNKILSFIEYSIDYIFPFISLLKQGIKNVNEPTPSFVELFQCPVCWCKLFDDSCRRD